MPGQHESFGIPDLRRNGEHLLDASIKLLGDSRSPAPRVERSNNLVTQVTYPDGKSRRFEYDEQGSLKAVVQPNGERWSRNTGGWASDKGRSFFGEIRVEPDGQYVTIDRSGVRRTYLTDGTKKVFEFSMTAITGVMARLNQILPSLNKDFDTIDTNKNGFLSEAELTASINNPSLSRESRLAATGLLLGHKTVMRLANDETMDSAGISRNDLKRYGAALETRAPDWLDRNGEYCSFGVSATAFTLGIESILSKRSPAAWLLLGATHYAMGEFLRSGRLEQKKLLDQKSDILSMIDKFR